jgi:hypothetical protein
MSAPLSTGGGFTVVAVLLQAATAVPKVADMPKLIRRSRTVLGVMLVIQCKPRSAFNAGDRPDHPGVGHVALTWP